LIGFPFPIILAILLNEVRQKAYKRTLQTVYTFPHFLSWVIVSGLVLNLLGDSGAAKKIATFFSPELKDTWNILYNSSIFRFLLVFTDIWKEGGWGSILYLAAIAGIDPSLYEAAIIDGCNRFQRIIHVTLPGIIGIIIVMFLLSVGNIMNANFDQVFNLYSPPVFKVGDILDTYIYRLSFQSTTVMDFGFSTAVGLFKSVINFALLTIANYTARAMGSEGIM
jgi:putative aldouronate transport system permease protein